VAVTWFEREFTLPAQNFFNSFLKHTTKIRLWKCIIRIVHRILNTSKRNFWRNIKESWSCFLIKSEKLINMKSNITFGNKCGRRIWSELLTGLWLVNLMEWGNLESLGVFRRIKLKCTFKENIGVWNGLVWLRRRNQLVELRIFDKR